MQSLALPVWNLYLMDPPGQFTNRRISLVGSTASKRSSWLMTASATKSSIWCPRNTIRCLNKSPITSASAERCAAAGAWVAMGPHIDSAASQLSPPTVTTLKLYPIVMSSLYNFLGHSPNSPFLLQDAHEYYEKKNCSRFLKLFRNPSPCSLCTKRWSSSNNSRAQWLTSLYRQQKYSWSQPGAKFLYWEEEKGQKGWWKGNKRQNIHIPIRLQRKLHNKHFEGNCCQFQQNQDEHEKNEGSRNIILHTHTHTHTLSLSLALPPS